MPSNQNEQTSPSSPQSWEDILESGYKRFYDFWKAERNELLGAKDKDTEARGQREKRHILSHKGGWDNMSVVNAIATIWAPLGMRHGYGLSQVFEIRDRDTQIQWLRTGSGQQSTACGQYKDKFIIPLYLMSEEQKEDVDEIGEDEAEFSSNKGKGKGKAQNSPRRKKTPRFTSKANLIGEGVSYPGPRSRNASARAKSIGKRKVKTKDEEEVEQEILGHLVLAVATKAHSKITVQVWDSRPGTVAPAEIEKAVQGVVTYSGWMGMSLDSHVWDHKPPLEFRHTIYETTPHQGSGNQCGLYTVLNAWANMLGIQIVKKTKLKLPEEKTLEGFHRKGTMIVNLALAGHMDSRTIQAFLKVYGYSKGQSRSKPVEDVQAEKMDDMILSQYVMNQKVLDDIDTSKIDPPYAGPWLL